MHFTNARSISKTSVNINNPKVSQQSLFVMNRTFAKPHSSSLNKSQSVLIPSQTIDTSKQITWGPPFWYFFHTLAEKIKPELFLENRDEVIGIVREVCRNLPCPSCALHATEYMNKIMNNSIKTKEDFKLMLFEFHNSVNVRKHVPLYLYSDLQVKYKQANFINIVNNFMHYYKMDHHVVRMIADNMYRKRSAQNIINWLHAHQNVFDK